MQDEQHNKESNQLQKLEAELSSARAADNLKQQLLDDLQTKLASQDDQVEVLAKVSETGEWPSGTPPASRISGTLASRISGTPPAS